MGDAPPPDGADLSVSDEDAGTPPIGGPFTGQDPPVTVPAVDLSKPEPAPSAEPADVVPPPMAPASEDAAPPLPPPAAAATAKDDTPSAVKGQAWKMALLVVVFLAVVVGAYILGKGGGDDKPSGTAASTTTTIDTSPVDTTGWTPFADDVSGFSLKHPKDWIVTGAPAGQNRLLISAGEQNFLLVTARNIDPATVADEIAQAMSDLDIISGPSELKIGGQPAILYIYNTPLTEENKTPGVIIHYFIVKGSKMYSLIFQARPKDELNRLARTYNAVTNSFQSTNDAPAPDPLPTSSTTPTTPTTAAGATTTRP